MDADDLITDGFTIAWMKRSKIPPDFETAWLIAVARNLVMSQRAKGLRRAALEHLTRHPPRHADSAEAAAITDLGARDALLGMSDSEREVLLMSAWENLSNREIAIALGISENTAAVRLSRAKKTFVDLIRCLPTPVRTDTHAECTEVGGGTTQEARNGDN
jgi:RNA polymerase sigma-70 factor (ECF subfamily)